MKWAPLCFLICALAGCGGTDGARDAQPSESVATDASILDGATPGPDAAGPEHDGAAARDDAGAPHAEAGAITSDARAPSLDTGVGSGDASSDAGSSAGEDGGATGTNDASSGRTSCDRRALRCRIAEPVCPEGDVASVVGTCYGPCVRLDRCACDEPEDCPFPDMYTCHRSAQHCGPFVN